MLGVCLAILFRDCLSPVQAEGTCLTLCLGLIGMREWICIVDAMSEWEGHSWGASRKGSTMSPRVNLGHFPEGKGKQCAYRLTAE